MNWRIRFKQLLKLSFLSIRQGAYITPKVFEIESFVENEIINKLIDEMEQSPLTLEETIDYLRSKWLRK